MTTEPAKVAHVLTSEDNRPSLITELLRKMKPRAIRKYRRARSQRNWFGAIDVIVTRRNRHGAAMVSSWCKESLECGSAVIRRVRVLSLNYFYWGQQQGDQEQHIRWLLKRIRKLEPIRES